MSRVLRLTAAALAVTALTAAPASAEFPPECKVHPETLRVTCTL